MKRVLYYPCLKASTGRLGTCPWRWEGWLYATFLSGVGSAYLRRGGGRGGVRVGKECFFVWLFVFLALLIEVTESQLKSRQSKKKKKRRKFKEGVSLYHRRVCLDQRTRLMSPWLCLFLSGPHSCSLLHSSRRLLQVQAASRDERWHPPGLQH